MILELLRLLVATLFLIFVHEIGHIVAYKYLKNRWPVVSFSKGCFVVRGSGLSSLQAKQFIASGVIAGFLVIILLLNVFEPYIMIALLVAYLWGCRDDLRELERLRRCG